MSVTTDFGQAQTGTAPLPVQRSFVLGWHLAQLFHGAVPRDPDQQEERQPRLIGLAHLNAGSRYRLQIRMVEADIRAIEAVVAGATGLPSTAAIEQALSETARSRDDVLDAIYHLHVDLLEALATPRATATFRSFLAYSLVRHSKRQNGPMSGGRGNRDDLVGAGRSQLGVDKALRARDVNRPTDEDLARAEAEVVIVQRHWQPPERAR